jgi:hypothetical protein
MRILLSCSYFDIRVYVNHQQVAVRVVKPPAAAEGPADESDRAIGEAPTSGAAELTRDPVEVSATSDTEA